MPSRAASPVRSTSRAKPAVESGAPRSEVKTKRILLALQPPHAAHFIADDGMRRWSSFLGRLTPHDGRAATLAIGTV
jgi:hypothetical protein